MIDIALTESGRAKVAAFEAGRAAWRALDAFGSHNTLTFPSTNPYGDEYQNPVAKMFRCGFDSAARADGYTYSRVEGEYLTGGEDDTDEFPEPGEMREIA